MNSLFALQRDCQLTKLEDYRQYIQQILTKYAIYKPAYREIEVETIFDTQRDHDQIVHIG